MRILAEFNAMEVHYDSLSLSQKVSAIKSVAFPHAQVSVIFHIIRCTTVFIVCTEVHW